MPDRRAHRGAHPKDRADFGDRRLTVLQRATDELSWLLSRGYPARRSLVLVGDRHALRARQRKAVGRAAVADELRSARAALRVGPAEVADRRVWVDGYNVLLTVEAALAGGVLLRCRDGALRDMAAMSQHYKRVEETHRALERIGELLVDARVRHVCWLFDRPISNSGRLRRTMLDLAEDRGWPWTVDLVANPDADLRRVIAPDLVATADSGILDRIVDPGVRWLDLAREVVEARVEAPWIVDLALSR
ncbi:MAG: DUF434 domain-containing protein [Acidobacteriota bacterium]